MTEKIEITEKEFKEFYTVKEDLPPKEEEKPKEEKPLTIQEQKDKIQSEYEVETDETMTKLFEEGVEYDSI